MTGQSSAAPPRRRRHSNRSRSTAIDDEGIRTGAPRAGAGAGVLDGFLLGLDPPAGRADHTGQDARNAVRVLTIKRLNICPKTLREPLRLPPRSVRKL